MIVNPPKKPKILCIDDEPDVLKALIRTLRTDFEVLTAESAEEGLGILDKNADISVLLSDFNLKGLSGGDFLRIARNKAPNAVRALLSGHIDLKQMSDSINRAEIHRLILKPWDNDYLIIQMKEALIAHSILVEKDLLRQLAITDPVTGLTNHRYFQETLQREWLHSKSKNFTSPLSLFMIDIDNFKSCNDRYGHLAGDQILAEIADRMNATKKGNESLSRYGGEEFALLLPNTESTDAHSRADSLRQQIAASPISLDKGINHALTVSIGVATQTKRQEFSRPADLIAAADTALYQAKKFGRNCTAVATSTHDRN